MSDHARRAMFVAAASAAAAAAVWALAFHVAAAGWADGVIAEGFIRLQTPLTKQLATGVAALAGEAGLALWCVLLVGVQLARRLPSQAVAVLLVLVGANVSTQLLKVALADPYEAVLGVNQVDAASWPSGHATSAMSMVLALVMVSPGGLRPLIGAVGGAFAVASAYSILLLDWHYPSDVVGGFLVALAWASSWPALCTGGADRTLAGDQRRRARRIR